MTRVICMVRIESEDTITVDMDGEFGFAELLEACRNERPFDNIIDVDAWEADDD